MDSSSLRPILCSALASTLGATVLTYEEYLKERDQDQFKALSVTDIYSLTHCYGGLGGELSTHVYEPKCFVDLKVLSVKTVKGNNIVIECSVEETIADIKQKLQSRVGIPANEQRIIFNGKKLEDGRTLSFYGIDDDCILYMTQLLKGGSAQRFYINNSLLDFKYDYDLTHKSDDGTNYYRGGKPYYRPYGWRRYGLESMMMVTIHGLEKMEFAPVHLLVNGQCLTTELEFMKAAVLLKEDMMLAKVYGSSTERASTPLPV